MLLPEFYQNVLFSQLPEMHLTLDASPIVMRITMCPAKDISRKNLPTVDINFFHFSQEVRG